MTPQAILPALVFPALYVFILYRRMRRHFGRQPFQPTRLTVRLAILSLVTAGFLYAAARQPALLNAGLVGLVLGAGLGVAGLRFTRFESGPEGFFYTPNTYIGVALSALLVGRLVYRFIAVGQAVNMAAAPGGNPFAAYTRNPLTLSIFTLLFGYYMTYFAGILIRARNPSVT
jgi:hypothetical protein